MEKKFKNLRWEPMWVSHLGCIKGCLEYLNIDVSDAWLFGATGHAFIINVHEVVCASGPTAWNTEMLSKLGENIGYIVDGVFSHKSKSDFAEKQKLAWEMVKQAIDEGLPCYGWELDIPEYYVVYGYDDEGYYFSGPRCDSGKGPKRWKELGDTEIGVLEMYSVKPGEAAEDITTVKEAFGFVLEHSKSPAKWIYSMYKAGLAGFDNWIHALETDKADGFGMAYNAAVWSECRNFAVKFLKEVKERLGGKFSPLFDEAAGHYEVVAQNLKSTSKMFPFPPKGDEIRDEARRKMALEHLRNTKKAEESGLRSLEKILREL
jgi:hypothetical protein